MTWLVERWNPESRQWEEAPYGPFQQRHEAEARARADDGVPMRARDTQGSGCSSYCPVGKVWNDFPGAVSL